MYELETFIDIYNIYVYVYVQIPRGNNIHPMKRTHSSNTMTIYYIVYTYICDNTMTIYYIYTISD